MDRVVEPLIRAPIPNLLVLAGLVFLGLAVIVAYSDRIKLDKTGRITAYLLGVVLLFTGLLMNTGLIPSGPTLNSVTAPPTQTTTPPAKPPSAPAISIPATPLTDSQDCFGQYLQGIPTDRRAILEQGTQAARFIGPGQSKDEPIALRLTENRRPLGAVRFDFYPSAEMFKIQSIVDASCQQVETYSNVSRGGDKHVLQNWDDLQLTLADAGYDIRFGFTGTEIEINFIGTSR